MGSSYPAAIQYPKCANCGHRTGRAGHMSIPWAYRPEIQFLMVCSPACGTRYVRRFENGMLPAPEWEYDRVSELRLRIKVLEYRARAAQQAQGQGGAG